MIWYKSILEKLISYHVLFIKLIWKENTFFCGAVLEKAQHWRNHIPKSHYSKLKAVFSILSKEAFILTLVLNKVQNIRLEIIEFHQINTLK